MGKRGDGFGGDYTTQMFFVSFSRRVTGLESGQASLMALKGLESGQASLLALTAPTALCIRKRQGRVLLLLLLLTMSVRRIHHHWKRALHVGHGPGAGADCGTG